MSIIELSSIYKCKTPTSHSSRRRAVGKMELDAALIPRIQIRRPSVLIAAFDLNTDGLIKMVSNLKGKKT